MSSHNCVVHGQHSFQPRYSIRTPEAILAAVNRGMDVTGDVMERIYVCDVCVTCGKIVKP